jgi:DNA ligase (NAD+)
VILLLKRETIGELIEVRSYLEKDNIDKALKKLEELKVHSLYNFLVNAESLNANEIEAMSLLVRILQIIYNNFDEPSPLTDEEYDILYERNRQFEEVVGAEITNAQNKVIGNHLYTDLRGSLHKVHFITRKDKGKDKRRSLEEWLDSIERIYPDIYKETLELKISPKYDGISIVFECEDNIVKRGLTRGFTQNNEAIVISHFNGHDFSVYNEKDYKRFGLKTEAIMKDNVFEEFKERFGDFKSPRSAVSSIFNSNDLNQDKLKYITLVPLRIQGFDSNSISMPESMEAWYPGLSIIIKGNSDCQKDRIITSIREVLEDGTETLRPESTPVDGAVITILNENVQKILGREDNINKFEVAYKYPPDQAKTTLKGIEFQVGLMGNVSPVAKIEPVKMKGNKIKSISLGSMNRFMELGLRLGDEVVIKYDIVPYLVIDDTCKRNMHEQPLPAPNRCPFCEMPLVKEPLLKCENPMCDHRSIGKIVNYITKMNIANIDEGIVESLYREGVLLTIKDLYSLDKHESQIIQMPGFGKKSFGRIVDGIVARSEVYDYELLGSLGIANIGRRVFNKITSIYMLPEIVEMCRRNDDSTLKAIPGIGGKMANKIIEGVIKNEELIRFLCTTLKVTRSVIGENGLKFCFTKVRDKDFEAYLIKQGHSIIDSVVKDLDILIVPDLSEESSKIQKAKKGGVLILEIEKAYEQFGYKK